jgi:ABC-type multidrug transport system fused ATPase/permease subunit
MLTAIRKMLDLLSEKEKVQLYLLLVALTAMALVEVAGIASILPFMAVVGNPDVIQSNRWLMLAYSFLGFGSLQSFLFFLGLLVLGLLILSNLSKTFITWLTLRYDNRLNYHMANRLLGSYLNRPYVFFLNRNTAEMGKNVLSEVRAVIAGVLSPGIQVISSGLVCLCILALLVAVDPWIALTILVVLGGTYALIYTSARRRLDTIGRQQLEANFLKYKVASEALSGIKDIKILGREHDFLARFSTHALRHAQNNVSAGLIAQLPRYALESIAFGGILLIVLYFLGFGRGLGNVVPVLALYAFAGYRLLPALQQIFSSFAQARSSRPTLDLLHDDLVKSTQRKQEIAFSKSQTIKPLLFKQELAIRNLTFSYPGTQEPVLKGIDLTIHANTSVGFVGATGSGKTTTVDVILGLLQPSSGKLLVDSVELCQANLSSWQLNLGYVPQSIFLCDDTITRNIAFGVPDEEIDREAVVRAARIANLDSFVENELENGFNTVIGERGVRLSGGQRQRIGIARALYRDPAVLILDEATSALDGVTEEAVMDALQKLSRKKTIIIIAHRLTTVKDCDVIFIMEHGKVVDQGTYDGLHENSEWFRAAARTGT